MLGAHVLWSILACSSPDAPPVAAAPAVADSDGDGWTDGEEEAANADPLDPDRHPYLGGWPIDACAGALESTGTDVGDVAPDFALQDQFGETVHLDDFCDHVVLVWFCVASGARCLEPLAGLEDGYEASRADGVMVVTTWGQDYAGGDLDTPDLAAIAADFDLTMPVLDDDASEYFDQFVDLGAHMPFTILLGRGGIVLDASGGAKLDEAEAAAQ